MSEKEQSDDIVERLKNASQMLHRPLSWPSDNEVVQEVLEDAIVAFARLRLLTPAAEWKPIETAPRDRTLLVGYRNRLGNWRTVVGSFYAAGTLESEHTDSGFADEGWYEESQTHDEILPTDEAPTHWMPLPPPPVFGGPRSTPNSPDE